MLLADHSRDIEFLHIDENPMVCDNLPPIDVRFENKIVGGLLNYEKPVICASNKKCFYITGNEIEKKAQYID